MTDRRFRFGAVAGAPGDAQAWAARGRSLQDHGFATLLVPDTLATPSPFLALTAAASATNTLRLGTWVLSAPLRPPAEVVRDAATLQQLSGGRLELGVGAGRPGGESDAERLGVAWGSPGRRVDQVQAALLAVRADDRPRPRLVVAASGERMLRLAGRLADTIALAVPPTCDADQLRAIARRARSLAGDEVELAVQLVGIGDDMPAWIRERMGLTPDALRARGVPTMLSGDTDRDADTLRALRSDTSISYFTIAEEYADRLAPVIARLGSE
jgi:probable F420-dependent oxidoreductase